MAWFIVILAGLLETGWALGLKSSQGFTRPVITTVTLIAMIASVWLLARAMQSLPVGTAYAVWTGIGTTGTVIAGMLWFGDALSPGRLLCVGLIIAGIVGLKILT
ncbi:multidrug resistance protein SugE [Alcanivorax hongdengensis A-11-3]|uniref:Guanidinium exporter n=1 Tax=Alcanivorax hongdengensis A-11-3 TaxID=1177179 RepID=L0WCT2_9GAMM|nr:multidrug efflux SMR transporter [Alcanivorax hongdengensis]EKF73902.1 multidrug resistance protein SugE [Alcanivorax hongdengensis A-11-3]